MSNLVTETFLKYKHVHRLCVWSQYLVLRQQFVGERSLTPLHNGQNRVGSRGFELNKDTMMKSEQEVSDQLSARFIKWFLFFIFERTDCSQCFLWQTYISWLSIQPLVTHTPTLQPYWRSRLRFVPPSDWISCSLPGFLFVFCDAGRSQLFHLHLVFKCHVANRC